MSSFSFSQEEVLTFFAVLVRYSVLFSLLPWLGDRSVPNPLKVLLSLSVSFVLFPSLVARGVIRPGEAIAWGANAGSIAAVIGMEALFGVIIGYTSRLIFEAITFGANLVGTFMGLASASMFDPHQETHTQVIAEIQSAIAMLIFLALDGHHLMLRAALESYRVVGIGQLNLSPAFSQALVQFTGEVFKIAIQLAAPVGVALFLVQIVFGVIARAIPQVNVLVLSFSVTILVGLAVMWIGLPEFAVYSSELFLKMSERMNSMMAILGS